MPSKRSVRPREVFLSHVSADRAFVKRLANEMRARGLRAWYSEAHILVAEDWHDKIGKALARCDWFIVVLSPRSVKSKWVKRELLYALQEDRYSERIAPILRKDCRYRQLSWTLRSLQFADFTHGFESGCHDLFRRWGLKF